MQYSLAILYQETKMPKKRDMVEEGLNIIGKFV